MNQEEFARRVTAMQNRMYRVACAYLRGEHDRLDAVSQAILRAWEKHGGLRQPQYFDTWLIRILIRECRHPAQAGTGNPHGHIAGYARP